MEEASMKRAIRTTLLAVAVMGLVLGLTAWRYQDLPMHECAWCQRKGVRARLNRHHIIQQKYAPDLRDEPRGLIILCRRCHFVLGHRCNWHTCNPDVREICERYTNTIDETTPVATIEAWKAKVMEDSK